MSVGTSFPIREVHTHFGDDPFHLRHEFMNGRFTYLRPSKRVVVDRVIGKQFNETRVLLVIFNLTESVNDQF